MKQVTFCLNDEDYKKVEAQSKLEKRSKASLVRFYFFKKLEELHAKSNNIN